jgi:hypothetical protein
MFTRESLDALFGELQQNWEQSRDFDQLSRDAHFAIAMSDSGRPLADHIDSRVIALIEKHKPPA